MAGYILLGCPRSGTNLLSSLLKHLEGVYFVVEPFSMNVPWVLRDDLVRTEKNKASLGCRCGHCYLCELRTEIRAGRINFKETSLFEYLDVLAEDFGIDRVVYLERDIKEVVRSYAKHDLWNAWNLCSRTVCAELPPDASRLGDHERAMVFGEMITLRKRELWQQHAGEFEVLSVRYEDLIASPHKVVAGIATFLELAPSPHLDQIIAQKLDSRSSTYAYATFH